MMMKTKFQIQKSKMMNLKKQITNSKAHRELGMRIAIFVMTEEM